jgi:hypothetical protein
MLNGIEFGVMYISDEGFVALLLEIADSLIPKRHVAKEDL